MSNWIVSVQPIAGPPEPGKPPPPQAANLGFNAQVVAANPLSALDKAKVQLAATFEASGIKMAEEAPAAPASTEIQP
jgi:hypothetical protein